MWRGVVLLAVMGCNQVYGLEPTKQRDAAELPDADNDGVFDLEDNCPDRANPEQYDADADLRGDVCDDCPLLSNRQGDDKDRDGLGDLCDPHPEDAGDCVLVVDGFGDPAAFASHWKVTATAPATAVPEPGRVVLKPAGSTSPVLITELSTTAVLADVTVLGRAMFRPSPDDVAVTAISSLQDASSYYGCRLEATQVAAEGPGPSIEMPVKVVPTEIVGDRFLARLSTARRAGAVDLTCRVDYGVSVGTHVAGGRPMLSGPAGVRVASREVTIDAIAITTFQPDQPCTTVYR